MTRAPQPVWEMTMSAGRRKARFRCFHCNHVVNWGDRALICANKKRVAHVHCGDRPHINGPDTVRDVMAFWGNEHLSSLGYKAVRA